MKHLFQFIKNAWLHIAVVIVTNVLLYNLLSRVKGGDMVIMFANLIFLNRSPDPLIRLILGALLTLICFHAVLIWYLREWFNLAEAVLMALAILVPVVTYLSPVLNSVLYGSRSSKSV